MLYLEDKFSSSMVLPGADAFEETLFRSGIIIGKENVLYGNELIGAL